MAPACLLMGEGCGTLGDRRVSKTLWVPCGAHLWFGAPPAKGERLWYCY